MGILSWLLGSNAEADRQVARVTTGPGTYPVDVVGESHYQDALERACGGRTELSRRVEVEARLELEDDNPYDEKAVAVHVDGRKVGRLDRETARSLRHQLGKVAPGVKRAACPAIIVGGWDRGPGDRGSFGIKLDLPVK